MPEDRVRERGERWAGDGSRGLALVVAKAMAVLSLAVHALCLSRVKGLII